MSGTTGTSPDGSRRSATSPRAASPSALTRCGKASCACRADPPRLHGPYWHFTAKVDGKTVNKRLTENEARLYERWIANDRTVRSLLAEMRTVAAEAQALILAEESSDRARPRSRTGSPEKRPAPIGHRS